MLMFSSFSLLVTVLRNVCVISALIQLIRIVRYAMETNVFTSVCYFKYYLRNVKCYYKMMDRYCIGCT